MLQPFLGSETIKILNKFAVAVSVNPLTHKNVDFIDASEKDNKRCSKVKFAGTRIKKKIASACPFTR